MKRIMLTMPLVHKVANRNRLFTHPAALVLAANLLALLLSNTYTQTGTSTVRGTVVDTAGAVVPGATVALRSERKDFTRSQTTDDDGGYAFKALPPDTYVIQVEAIWFKKAVVTGVNSKANLEVAVTVELAYHNSNSDISEDAAARARVTDIKPPIVEFRPTSYLSMCGSRSYLVKDAVGGYLLFTMHTADMPHPLTVDNPLLSPESWLPVNPNRASTFASERPLEGTESALLVKLLQEWRDSAIPEQKLRRFKHYAGLKHDAAINKFLKSLSEADSDLLSLWFVVLELETKRK